MSAWSEATLCTDQDLQQWESRMPELGMATLNPNGKSAYDGKRALAKERIGAALRRRGMNPDGLKTPSQLKTAAVFLELSLIFRDMALRGDGAAAEHADYYLQQFDNEIEELPVDYEEPPASGTGSGGDADSGNDTVVPGRFMMGNVRRG